MEPGGKRVTFLSQCGLGRSGGRPASGRGRIRSRGPIGGGTACKGLPQLGQSSSPALGPERCARSQCPRAAQSWLIHCTVQPGKYCMLLPPVAAAGNLPIAVRPKQHSKQPRQCRIVMWFRRWCQEQTTQSIGSRLHACGFPVKLSLFAKARWPREFREASVPQFRIT
jgi:hypothetical protein